MISKLISWFKKYFWVPLVLFIFLILYFVFGSKKTEKNITKFLNKNNEIEKEKNIKTIVDRTEFEEESNKLIEDNNEKINKINSNYSDAIEDLKLKEEEEKSRFEEMSNEELADMLASKYKLNKGKIK